MTAAELRLILLALNDREGVLSTDYQRIVRSGGPAELQACTAEMRAVRALADKVSAQLNQVCEHSLIATVSSLACDGPHSVCMDCNAKLSKDAYGRFVAA